MRFDRPIPAGWERPRLDRSIHTYMEYTKTAKGAFQSTKRFILSTVDCFEDGYVRSQSPFEAGVEKGRHYRAEQTRYSIERPCSKDFSNA
jgi:hypothetical protein